MEETYTLNLTKEELVALSFVVENFDSEWEEDMEISDTMENIHQRLKTLKES